MKRNYPSSSATSSNAADEEFASLLNYRFGAPASSRNSDSISPISSNSNSEHSQPKKRKLNSLDKGSSSSNSRTASPTGTNINFSNYLKFVSPDSTFYSNCVRNRRESIDVAALIDFQSKKSEKIAVDSNFGFQLFQAKPLRSSNSLSLDEQKQVSQSDKSKLRRNSIMSYTQSLITKTEVNSNSCDNFLNSLQREYYRNPHFGKDFLVAFGCNKFGQCLQLETFETLCNPLLIPSGRYQHEAIRQILCRYNATFIVTESGQVLVGGNAQNGTIIKKFGFELENYQIGSTMIPLQSENLFLGHKIVKMFLEGDEEGAYALFLCEQGKLFVGGKIDRYEDFFETEKLTINENTARRVRPKVGLVEFDNLHQRFTKDAFMSEQVYIIAVNKNPSLEDSQPMLNETNVEEENTELLHYGRLTVGDHYELLKLPVPFKQVKKIDTSF